MNLARTIAQTNLIIGGHILNPFWWPRDARRARRMDVSKKIIPNYLARYVAAPGTIPERTPIVDDNENVFMFWGYNPMPKLVDACMRSATANLHQNIISLNEKTLFNHIDLPGVIMDKFNNGKIGVAHFLDICRVELLYNHGGFWLDATAFVTSPIPSVITDSDFFVFMAGKNVGNLYSFIQNYFIRARRGSYLLDAWRVAIHNFWLQEPRQFDYFMHQLLFKALVDNDPLAAKYFEQMPKIDQNVTHAVWWSVANEPFNQELFDKRTRDAFFQKTTYNSPWAKEPIPGSVADVMINKMNK